MADAARGLLGVGLAIGAGFLGPGGFSAVQFAVAQFLFNLIVPPKTAIPDEGVANAQGAKSTAVDTVLPRVFGVRAIEGGLCLRCAADLTTGERSGIRYKRKKVKVGSSGFGPFKKSVKQKKTFYYLYATFGLCEGTTRIVKIVKTNPGDGADDEGGDIVIWNVYGTAGDPVTAARLEDLQRRYAAATPIEQLFLKSQIDAIKAVDYKGLNLTPVYGPISGDVIGHVSDQVALWYGTEEQPQDEKEQSWYEDEGGCSADRGITKVRFSGYNVQLGTTFTYHLENEINGRREIISFQLGGAGVPDSRMWLRSIAEEAHDEGWFSDSSEPARTLAEQVAAMSFHDLHFMPVRDDDGEFACLGFTDISRVSPRYIYLDDDETGAVVNTGGSNFQFNTSSQNHRETGESKPRSLSISFYNLLDDQKNTAAIASYPNAKGEPQSVSLRYVGELQDVQDFADVAMLELQAASGTSDITLMPARCEVAPGCVLVHREWGKRAPMGRDVFKRVVGQGPTPEGLMPSQTAPYDGAVYRRQTPVRRFEGFPPSVRPSQYPSVVSIDGPCLTDDMATTPTLFLAAVSDPGFDVLSCVAKSSDGAFDDVEIGEQATSGVLITPYNFTDADLYSFNTILSLRVVMAGGVFEDTTEELIEDRNANLIYLLHPDGGGTYLHFLSATEIDTDTYLLSGLRPGAFGRDDVRVFPALTKVIAMTTASGDEADGIFTVPFALDRRGSSTQITLTDEDEQNTVADPVELALDGVCLTALSPAPKVSFAQDIATGEINEGDFRLTFFARSRLVSDETGFWSEGNAVWTGADPLSFQVRLKNGADIVDERTALSDSAQIDVPYTRDELVTLFGAVPNVISGELQHNGTHGPGFVRAFTVAIVFAEAPVTP